MKTSTTSSALLALAVAAASGFSMSGCRSSRCCGTQVDSAVHGEAGAPGGAKVDPDVSTGIPEALEDEIEQLSKRFRPKSIRVRD